MTTDAANHHAGYPGFAGVTGLLVGLVMTVAGCSVARLAADLAAVSDADRVIDVGCGPGTAVREAARRGASVTGVDPAPVMLRLARTLTPHRLPIIWTKAVAEDLRQPDGSATVVWSLATVHHWTDITMGLAEIKRVLVPGGRFLAVERRTRPGATGLASHGWTEHQAKSFATQCQAVGFVEVRVEEHSPGRRTVWVVTARRA
ncbi:MAG: class I SAM-dependent methyltransferase [Pseudonocardiaceae bacterium]